MNSSRLTRRNFLRASSVTGIIVPLSGFTWIESMLAPKAEPWPRWTQHDNGSTAKIDHTMWTAFLATYVAGADDGINRVRYADVSAFDLKSLDEYLAYLTALPISTYARLEQVPYWINLYNARTVRLILAHYPITSIMKLNISPGWLSSGPWDKKLMTVEGIDLSLNDIEHRILRAGVSDNRIHYALNCASLGCPNLQPAAFTPDNMEDWLSGGARMYINHPRGVTIGDDGVVASKIYAWFKQDFGNDDRAVLDHLEMYADAPLKSALDEATSILSYAYDWNLNDA